MFRVARAAALLLVTVSMTPAGAPAADPPDRRAASERGLGEAIARAVTLARGQGHEREQERAPLPGQEPFPDVAATGSVGSAPTRGPDPVTMLAGLLETRRHTILVERWLDVPIAARVEWARKVYGNGGSSVLGPLAIRDLWTEGLRAGLGPDARIEAVRWLFYTYLRLRIDGQLCVDASGPGDLLRDLRAEFRPVFAYAATLPPAVTRGLAFDAIAMEQASAAARDVDPYLCERGRLGLRNGHFIDRDTAAGLVSRTREAAGRDLVGFARGAAP